MSNSKRGTPTNAPESKLAPDESQMMPAAQEDDDTQDGYAYEEIEDTDDTEANVTPSWFGKSLSASESEELADQYRAVRTHAPMFEQPSPEAYESYRRRLEERFQSAKRIAAGPVPPFSTMPEDRRSGSADDDDGNLRFREWQKKMNARRRGSGAEGGGRRRMSPVKIAGLFAVACTIGGVAGVASANMSLLKHGYNATLGGAATSIAAIKALISSPPARVGVADAGGSTVLTKKPVRIPRVDVADASGVLNNPIPLAMSAIPADPDMPLALKITGLPSDAYLTQGTQVATGEWLLKPAEIEGVKLVVPRAKSPQLDLAVAAVEEKTGVQAAPPREMTVELDLDTVKVQPASAPPEVQTANSPPLPQAIPLPQEAENREAKTLLGKGEALLKTGDLVSARQFFMKAHVLGLAEGAYGAGRTYDPAVYTAMNVRGLEPDVAKAREWYDKAASEGYEDAIQALEKLDAAAP